MIRLTAALLAALLVAGCGYHVGEIRPTPMRSVRTLAVPTFKNTTYEPRIEVLLADTAIKQFQSDGTYTITSEDQADAILYCTITKVERRPLRSVVNNVLATSEFGLVIEVNFEILDRVTGVQLMAGRARGESSFFSSDNIQTDEQQAIPVAGQDMATDLVAEVSEGW